MARRDAFAAISARMQALIAQDHGTRPSLPSLSLAEIISRIETRRAV